MLTNRELAGNETWITAILWDECAFCGFLSMELELVKPAVPCPNCEKSGRPRIIFPDIASVRLLEMINHFYAQAWDRREDHAARLARELSERLGRKYEPAVAVEAALETQRVRSISDGSQAAFDGLLDAIQEKLHLESAGAARKAFVPLLEYSATNEEHQVVVLLTAAMLEKLLRELLLRMLVKRSGGDWEESRKRLRKVGRQDGREDIFQNLTGTGLREAIAGVGVPDFYDSWRKLRELRNEFMHGKPFVIGVSNTEKAFDVAQGAFGVFAGLQNRFCVDGVREGTKINP